MGGESAINDPEHARRRMAKVPWTTDISVAVGSAVIASALVTPIVLTIDKAVV